MFVSFQSDFRLSDYIDESRTHGIPNGRFSFCVEHNFHYQISIYRRIMNKCWLFASCWISNLFIIITNITHTHTHVLIDIRALRDDTNKWTLDVRPVVIIISAVIYHSKRAKDTIESINHWAYYSSRANTKYGPSESPVSCSLSVTVALVRTHRICTIQQFLTL